MGALSIFKNTSYGYANGIGDTRPIHVFSSMKQYVRTANGLSFQSKVMVARNTKCLGRECSISQKKIKANKESAFQSIGSILHYREHWMYP